MSPGLDQIKHTQAKVHKVDYARKEDLGQIVYRLEFQVTEI